MVIAADFLGQKEQQSFEPSISINEAVQKSRAMLKEDGIALSGQSFMPFFHSETDIELFVNNRA